MARKKRKSSSGKRRVSRGAAAAKLGKKKTPVKGRATKRAGKITFRGRTSKVKSRVMTPRKRSAGTVKTKKARTYRKK